MKCLNSNWTCDIESNIPNDDSFYNQYHYFNIAARNVIYSNNTSSDVVWNFKYHFADSSNEPVQYHIFQGDKRFSLNVNGVRLKLFNTGIGILIFELENTMYPDIADVKFINDYGRRLYMPFSSKGSCYICADSISISQGEKQIAGSKIVSAPLNYSQTVLPGIVTHFFTNEQYSVTAYKNECNKNVFYIEPIIDERMFVACYYINKSFAECVTEKIDGQYRYLYDAEHKPLNSDIDSNSYNAASKLYELIFIDTENNLTCQNGYMLKQMLEQHVYPRWTDAGSVTGITEYSIVSVTSCETDYLIRSFLTEYIEMAIICLAQRASLINFESRLSICAAGKADIKKVHQDYVLFQSQLVLNEITPQQQGIELYKMLCENMYLSELTEEVNKHCESLFLQSTAMNETRENRILFIIAILGCLETVGLLIDWIVSPAENLFKLSLSAVLTILFFCLCFIPRLKKK